MLNFVSDDGNAAIEKINEEVGYYRFYNTIGKLKNGEKCRMMKNDKSWKWGVGEWWKNLILFCFLSNVPYGWEILRLWSNYTFHVDIYDYFTICVQSSPLRESLRERDLESRPCGLRLRFDCERSSRTDRDREREASWRSGDLDPGLRLRLVRFGE